MKNFYLFLLFVFSTIQVMAQFALPKPIANSFTGKSVCAFSDLDGDTDVDIVTGLTAIGDIVFYKNDGSGGFAPAKIISRKFRGADEIIRDIWVADLDGDGKKDVITLNSYSSIGVYWFKNLGADSFSNGKAVYFKSVDDDLWSTMSMADLDGDNDLDILFGMEPDLALTSSWLEHLPNDSFSAPKQLPGGAGGPTEAVDLDNDGDLDVISSWSTGYTQPRRGFAWQKNDGKAKFEFISIGGSPGYSGDNTLMTVKPTDFDLDGDLDVIVITSRNFLEIALYRNKGKGKFSINPEVLYMSTTAGRWDFDVPTRFDIADFDGDNDADIVMGYTSKGVVEWFENHEGDRLIDRGNKELVHGGIYQFKDMADLDGDGDLDLISGGFYYENLFKSKYQLKGTIFYDEDKNGKQDAGEHGMNLSRVQINNTSIGEYTSLKGAYFFAVNPGTYTIQSSTADLWKRSSDSSTYTRTLSDTNPLEDGLDFGFYPRKIVTKITPRLVGHFPRCNSEISYWVHIKNDGTTTPSGVVHLKLHDSIKYVSSKTTPDSIKGTNIYWSYTDLLPTQDLLFKLRVELPPMNSRTEWLRSNLNVYEVDAGKVVYTNQTSMGQSLRCAYDPNDKSVLPLGEGPLGLIEKDEPLEYLIRFQNTGNDTAFNVMIRDHLDADLDLNSIEPLASSHPMEMWVEKDGEVVFKFADILLPDSNVNEEESHGFVSFSATPKKSLAPLTTISSPANIYFDYNPPIITNSVINTVNCYLLPEPVVEWNPPYLASSLKGGYDYQWYFNGDTLKADTLETIRPTQKGEYSVEVTDRYTCNKKSEAYSFIPTGVSTLNSLGATIYPNPFSETTSIWFDQELEGGQLVFFDALGRKVYGIEAVQGRNVTVKANDLGKGLFMVYYLSATGKEKNLIGRVIAE